MLVSHLAMLIINKILHIVFIKLSPLRNKYCVHTVHTLKQLGLNISDLAKVASKGKLFRTEKYFDQFENSVLRYNISYL